MKKAERIFYVITFALLFILASCKNGLSVQNKCEVKFGAAFAERAILPEYSASDVQKLTDIEICCNYEVLNRWSTYADFIADDSVYEVPKGVQYFSITAYIGNIRLDGNEYVEIGYGTNQVNFELGIEGWSNADEEGNLSFVCYFPAIEAEDLIARIKFSNPDLNSTVTEFHLCEDSDSEYYGMMYFEYSKDFCATRVDMEIRVESITSGKIAYHKDDVVVVEGKESSATIVITDFIDCNYAVYYSGIDSDGNLIVYKTESFTKYQGYTVDDSCIWYTDEDCTEYAPYSYSSNEIDGNLYFYIENFKDNEYVTITFETNGGSEIAPISVLKGSRLLGDSESLDVYSTITNSWEKNPQLVPLKKGALFWGYYIDEDLNNSVSQWDGTVVTEDITLYARFCNLIQVSFVAEDTDYENLVLNIPEDSILFNDYYAFGGTSSYYISSGSEPLKENSTFVGWYFDEYFEESSYAYIIPEGSDNITLYAKFVSPTVYKYTLPEPLGAFAKNEDFGMHYLYYDIPTDDVLKKGDVVNINVKGTSTIDINSLYMNIIDNSEDSEGNYRWVDLASFTRADESIEAETPFDLTITITITQDQLGTGSMAHKLVIQYDEPEDSEKVAVFYEYDHDFTQVMDYDMYRVSQYAGPKFYIKDSLESFTVDFKVIPEGVQFTVVLSNGDPQYLNFEQEKVSVDETSVTLDVAAVLEDVNTDSESTVTVSEIVVQNVNGSNIIKICSVYGVNTEGEVLNYTLPDLEWGGSVTRRPEID